MGKLVCLAGHLIKFYPLTELKHRWDGQNNLKKNVKVDKIFCDACNGNCYTERDGGYYSCEAHCDFDFCKNCATCGEKDHLLYTMVGYSNEHKRYAMC